MLGNPYYVPSYEDYYQPELHSYLSNPISPENRLLIEQRSRRVARNLEPIITPLALLGPPLLAGYSLYKTVEQYEKDKAEADRLKQIEEQREARVAKIRARSAANIERKKLEMSRQLLDTQKELGRLLSRRIEAPSSTKKSVSSPLSSSSSGEQPIITEIKPEVKKIDISPGIKLTHVDLPEHIIKDTVHGSTINEIDTYAAGVMKGIRSLGSVEEFIRQNPTLDIKHKKVLLNIPEALTSRNYFPKPYLDLLDINTRNKYEKIKKREIKKYDPITHEKVPVSREYKTISTIPAGAAFHKLSPTERKSRKSGKARSIGSIQDIKRAQLFDTYKQMYTGVPDDKIWEMVDKATIRKK